MYLSNKSRAAIAIFTAVSTTVLFTGCDDSSKVPGNTGSEAETNADSSQVLKDDNGNEYTLVQNPDGTETAKYADGKEVTFKRDDDGNLNLISGAGGLLAGLAAGYFLFHGLNSTGGSFSNGVYHPSSPPTAISQSERTQRMSRYVPSNTKLKDIPPKKEDNKSGGSASSSKTTGNSNSSNGNSSNAKSNSNNSSTSKSNVSNGTAKSGFGSAGARSGGGAS
jgi:hypothetical protein